MYQISYCVFEHYIIYCNFLSRRITALQERYLRNELTGRALHNAIANTFPNWKIEDSAEDNEEYGQFLDDLEQTADAVVEEANLGYDELILDDPADPLPPMDADDNALKAADEARDREAEKVIVCDTCNGECIDPAVNTPCGHAGCHKCLLDHYNRHLRRTADLFPDEDLTPTCQKCNEQVTGVVRVLPDRFIRRRDLEASEADAERMIAEAIAAPRN